MHKNICCYLANLSTEIFTCGSQLMITRGNISRGYLFPLLHFFTWLSIPKMDVFILFFSLAERRACIGKDNANEMWVVDLACVIS
jgi:hypothetical protein